MTTMITRLLVALILLASAAEIKDASAQVDLMITDSGAGDRVMLFDGQTGALIDLNWITDIGQPYVFTTPKEAAVVGNQIWVSDQVVDAVHRFDFARSYLGSITLDAGGNTLDNIRGFGYDGTNVYLTRFHSNSALRGLVVIDAASATPTGFLPTVVSTHSLFDAEPFGLSELLVTNSSTNNVERYRKSDGVFLGNFATGVTFPQQVAAMSDGSIVTVATIAAAGVEGVYHYETNGALRRFIDTEGLKMTFGEHVPRGAWVLGDGNYLIATSNGVFKYDVGGDTFSVMAASVDAQYINPFVIPEPAGISGFILVSLMMLRFARTFRSKVS